ncbi:40S ribosomal protein S12, putative [Theileria equi strain WA]|uniref:40S ribosomal protein S12 n=1 Tax=Theileria equi strain WA TaxID=1537102 RepID=L1LD52_THEEQ|nr:40S ribosomal protein S12, putative [Theileria equi strain WA]EKX73209.1 40S ribosomal protein S12, putative [Theileria equi strain WA]|eukprot:XP_004832661.1 40S ribosomal protein S12, putative [Theileria equi strain WA]
MTEDGSPEVINYVDEDDRVTDLPSAIQKVLTFALAHGGLVRGLHEVAKALDSKTAQVCFLSKGCSEPAYVKLVQALCKEHSIPLIETDCDSKTLGQWAGLCKYDVEGKPRKIVGATSVAVKDFGEESEALAFLQNHIANLKN